MGNLEEKKNPSNISRSIDCLSTIKEDQRSSTLDRKIPSGLWERLMWRLRRLSDWLAYQIWCENWYRGYLEVLNVGCQDSRATSRIVERLDF